MSKRNDERRFLCLCVMDSPPTIFFLSFLPFFIYFLFGGWRLSSKEMKKIKKEVKKIVGREERREEGEKEKDM